LKRLKIIWILFGVVLIIATGFYREFFFVNINEQMRYLWYGNEESMMSDALSLLDSLDYWTLYYLKWAMTVVFSGIFLIESALFTKLILGKTLWKELIFMYTILLIVSGLVLAGYALFDEHETGYLISRYFMGIAQSPIPLMILLPAIGLRNRLGVSQ
jgi:hypothetical protein